MVYGSQIITGFYVPLFDCGPRSCRPRSCNIVSGGFGLFDMPMDYSNYDCKNFMNSLAYQLGKMSEGIGTPDYNYNPSSSSFSSSSSDQTSTSVLDEEGHYKPKELNQNKYEKFSDAGVKDSIKQLRKLEDQIKELNEMIALNPANKDELEEKRDGLIDSLSDLEEQIFGHNFIPYNKEGQPFYTNLDDKEIDSIIDNNQRIAKKQKDLDKIGEQIDEIQAKMKEEYDYLVAEKRKASPDELRVRKRNEQKIKDLQAKARKIALEMNKNIRIADDFMKKATGSDKSVSFRGDGEPEGNTGVQKVLKEKLFNKGNKKWNNNFDDISSLLGNSADFKAAGISKQDFNTFFSNLKSALSNDVTSENFADRLSALLTDDAKLKTLFPENIDIKQLKILKYLCEKFDLSDKFKNIQLSKLPNSPTEYSKRLEILKVIDNDKYGKLRSDDALAKMVSENYDKLNKMLQCVGDSVTIESLLVDIDSKNKGKLFDVLSKMTQDDIDIITGQNGIAKKSKGEDIAPNKINAAMIKEIFKDNIKDNTKYVAARKLLFLLIEKDIITHATEPDSTRSTIVYHYKGEHTKAEEAKNAILHLLINPKIDINADSKQDITKNPPSPEQKKNLGL